ncbi:MAG: hypothetical protein P8L44_19270 [Opitutales bacterium]|nr:hypothetical protein [Opitutales bacterium]
MDQTAMQVAFNYIGSTGFAVSKRSLSHLEDDQRWFHEGFARYVGLDVLKDLLGAKDREAVSEQLYPIKVIQSISTSELLSWNEEAVDGSSLRFISYQVFRNVQERHRDEILAQWFQGIDDSFTNIVRGRKTAYSIFEELTGDSLAELLVVKH